MFSRMVPENRCGVCSTTPDAGLDGVQRKIAVILPADLDAAVFGFIKAAEQVDDGRFAAAGGAYQGDRFAAFHQQVEVLQHRLFILVPEGDMVELDIALE